jgi:hypothetical protein
MIRNSSDLARLLQSRHGAIEIVNEWSTGDGDETKNIRVTSHGRDLAERVTPAFSRPPSSGPTINNYGPSAQQFGPNNVANVAENVNVDSALSTRSSTKFARASTTFPKTSARKSPTTSTPFRRKSSVPSPGRPDFAPPSATSGGSPGRPASRPSQQLPLALSKASRAKGKCSRAGAARPPHRTTMPWRDGLTASPAYVLRVNSLPRSQSRAVDELAREPAQLLALSLHVDIADLFSNRLPLVGHSGVACNAGVRNLEGFGPLRFLGAPAASRRRLYARLHPGRHLSEFPTAITSGQPRRLSTGCRLE